MTAISFIKIIQYLATALLFFDLLYVMRKKPSALQAHVVILLIATILMFIGYSVEIQADSLEAALLGAYTSYLGKPFIMLESFMLVCFVYGRKISSLFYTILMSLCALIPIILFSNSRHRLFYATASYDSSRPFSPLVLTHGPLYGIFVLQCILFFGSCMYIILSDLLYNRQRVKNQRHKELMLCSCAMVLFSGSGYILYLLDMTYKYDSTMLGNFASVLCLSLMFFKYNLFDAVTLAKDYALDDASVGLIVYDDKNEFAYSNDAANTLLHQAEFRNYLDHFTGERGEISTGSRVYALRKKELTADGTTVGHSLEINDITYSRNYQTLLEQEVKERTEKIERFQKAIISSLADVVDTRSLETGNHIRRTSTYAERIARALKKSGRFTDILTEQNIELLALSAPLHDLGKVSIPDSILLKQEKLTEEEFQVMKTHAKNGAILIERTMSGLESEDFMRMAVDIAHYHHEWYDGSGYPCGLKGAEIPPHESSPWQIALMH